MNLARRLMPLLRVMAGILDKITKFGIVSYVVNGAQIEISPSSGQTTIRFDNSPNVANFIAEFDVKNNMSGSNNATFVYRTSNWNTQGVAYCVGINGSNFVFGKQDNAGGTNAPWYDLGGGSHGAAADAWLHFKLVINGTSHKIYVNDVLKFDVTDSSFTAAGQFGINCYLTGQTRYFQNITITPL